MEYKMDLEEAFSLLENEVERCDTEGSYWEEEHTGERVTTRQAFEFIKKELATLQQLNKEINTQNKGVLLVLNELTGIDRAQ